MTMSDTNAQEPTMEEILASIRRIISEDDQPQAPAAAAEPEASAPEPPRSEPSRSEPAMAASAMPAPARPAPAPPATAEQGPSPVMDDDVLELTDAVDPPRPQSSKPPYLETVGDLDVFSGSEPSAPPPSKPRATAPAFADEPLIGSYAAEQSAGHFGALARTMAMPKEGRTLEDVVREMLKPMLRDWLDQHLPSIVEARVQAEVERISRRQEY